jgi:hypothetical protein
VRRGTVKRRVFQMKVHLVEVLVVDHDDLGEEGVRSAIENTRYPNRCIMPQVLDICTETTVWSDDHELNQKGWKEAARALFDQRDAEVTMRKTCSAPWLGTVGSR